MSPPADPSRESPTVRLAPLEPDIPPGLPGAKMIVGRFAIVSAWWVLCACLLGGMVTVLRFCEGMGAFR